jgi:CheY-like chemotaxis protein
LARKILLADDSVTAQNMGRKILADAGYEVIAVNNGSAALKKIAELKPDLVILDVYMPGYSGLEVCQRLKESQETARIPVLLSVGKLEPFKPEEAQRVRAEGYIVKPFEASELLSALSKLEDKVVRRAEPSKPGRFARAMAAADDTDRAGRNEPSATETGWKSRIAFPHKETEAEGTIAHGTQAAAETKVDVAAFAPIGVPRDVTPAEVTAITAAAAQIQMAEATTREDRKTSEAAASDSQATGEFAVQPAPENFQASGAEEMQPSSCAEANPQAPQQSIDREAGNRTTASPELPAVELDHRRNGDSRSDDERREESQNAPATMAASAESTEAAGSGLPRWTAVPVALASDEAAISLDHEMQKAYAAYAAADYATSAGSVEAEPAAHESFSAPSENAIQPPAAAISDAEPAMLPEPAPLPAEADMQTPAATRLENSNENLPSVSDFASLAQDQDQDQDKDKKELELAAAGTAGISAAPEPGSPVPQSASADSFASIPASSGPKLDTEAVKTTAAAWASWRQIRDTSKSDEQPQTQTPPFASTESSPSDTAALAAAAGAGQALQETASASPTENPADVASIVESVLAGLRPKLMEEITRKMAEKK